MHFSAYLESLRQFAEGQPELYKKQTPLGLDVTQKPILAKERASSLSFSHICVNGSKRTAYIKRLLCALSTVYKKEEANYLILSPKNEYNELLRLQTMDITAPFIRSVEDIQKAQECVKELVSLYKTGNGFPKLFIVLDGLEEVLPKKENDELEEYRAFFDIVLRQQNVEIISGVQLLGSIFSGYPGAYVGVGNTLITTREDGKADITFVDGQSTLSLPMPLGYPTSPSFTETVIALNATAAANEEK